MDHGIEGPKEFDLYQDVRKKKVNGRIVWRFRADLISACKSVFDPAEGDVNQPGPLPVSAIVSLRLFW